MRKIYTPMGLIYHYGRGYIDIDRTVKADEWHGPLFLHIGVTNKCNLSCPWCYADSGPKASGYIPIQQVKAIVDIFQDTLIGVSLSGGEPLLYPHLEDALLYIHSKGLATSITTNGLLLKPDMEIYRYLDEIRISLYPYNIRHLEKLLPKLVKNTRERDIELGLNIMVFNVEDALKLAKKFHSYIDSILYTGFIPVGRGTTYKPLKTPVKDGLLWLVKETSRLGVTVKLSGHLARKLDVSMLGVPLEGVLSIYPGLAVKPYSLYPREWYITDVTQIPRLYRMFIKERLYTVEPTPL